MFPPPFSAIENSSADILIVSTTEVEQSESDCDINEALETDSQSEPSLLVTSPEGWVLKWFLSWYLSDSSVLSILCTHVYIIIYYNVLNF